MHFISLLLEVTIMTLRPSSLVLYSHQACEFASIANMTKITELNTHFLAEFSKVSKVLDLWVILFQLVCAQFI